MKKTIKLLAVFMIVAMLSVALTSCKTVLMGKYSATTDLAIYKQTTTYEFGLFGSVTKTTVKQFLTSDPEITEVKGKYEIAEDQNNPEQLVIIFEFEGEDRTTASFVQGEEGGVKYIKIVGIQYNAVEE